MVRESLNVAFSLIWGVVNSAKKNSLFEEIASDYKLLKKRKIWLFQQLENYFAYLSGQSILSNMLQDIPAGP